MKAKKKKNPQDLTLRNLRALKKRIERLEQWNKAISLDLDCLFKLANFGPGKASRQKPVEGEDE